MRHKFSCYYVAFPDFPAGNTTVGNCAFEGDSCGWQLSQGTGGSTWNTMSMRDITGYPDNTVPSQDASGSEDGKFDMIGDFVHFEYFLRAKCSACVRWVACVVLCLLHVFTD